MGVPVKNHIHPEPLIEGFTALRSKTGAKGALKAMKSNTELLLNRPGRFSPPK